MKTQKDNLPFGAFLRQFLQTLSDDAIAAYSAQAAFFIIISFFPFAMLLMSILKFFPVEISELPDAGIFLPDAVTELLSVILAEIRQKSSVSVLSITAITGLWSASLGFYALTGGLNSVYGTKAAKNSILSRIGAIVTTVVFAAVLLATLLLWTFGSRILSKIEELIPDFSLYSHTVLILRSILGYAGLALFFLMIYMFVPNRKTKALRELPGAMICAAGWIGFSFLFSFYIDHFSSYTYVYGSLTAVVLMMLWVYFCMMILLIGAEINKAMTTVR